MCVLSSARAKVSIIFDTRIVGLNIIIASVLSVSLCARDVCGYDCLYVCDI